MNFSDSFQQQLSTLRPTDLESAALEAFDYQYKTNKVYQKYCDLLKKRPENVRSLEQIPFIPIEFFKEHQITCGTWKEETIFQSSGTTLQKRSKHYIRNLDFYREHSRNIFRQYYGDPAEYQFLALLPSYQEAGDSSLVYMVDYFISLGKSGSGYFLNQDKLLIEHLADEKHKKILIGVSYALLDLIEKFDIHSSSTIIMETGGMKGRRKEMIKEELHKELANGFGVSKIHSEYGMTELLSQAYSSGNGVFQTPNCMKILIRDINDPFQYLPNGRTGGVNVVDLGNIDSCCFVETKDLGKIDRNDEIRLLGRFDNSDIRGCNLLLA
jgi:phenylacetate-coenzyme A ligase PaaK-like adenylate-forming protein